MAEKSPEDTLREKKTGSHGDPDKMKGNKVKYGAEIDHDSTRNVKNDDVKPVKAENTRGWRFRISRRKENSLKSVSFSSRLLRISS